MKICSISDSCSLLSDTVWDNFHKLVLMCMFSVPFFGGGGAEVSLCHLKFNADVCTLLFIFRRGDAQVQLKKLNVLDSIQNSTLSTALRLP